MILNERWHGSSNGLTRDVGLVLHVFKSVPPRFDNLLMGLLVIHLTSTCKCRLEPFVLVFTSFVKQLFGCTNIYIYVDRRLAIFNSCMRRMKLNTVLSGCQVASIARNEIVKISQLRGMVSLHGVITLRLLFYLKRWRPTTYGFGTHSLALRVQTMT